MFRKLELRVGTFCYNVVFCQVFNGGLKNCFRDEKKKKKLQVGILENIINVKKEFYFER